jgi:hypothetical protein
LLTSLLPCDPRPKPGRACSLDAALGGGANQCISCKLAKFTVASKCLQCEAGWFVDTSGTCSELPWAGACLASRAPPAHALLGPRLASGLPRARARARAARRRRAVLCDAVTARAGLGGPFPRHDALPSTARFAPRPVQRSLQDVVGRVLRDWAREWAQPSHGRGLTAPTAACWAQEPTPAAAARARPRCLPRADAPGGRSSSLGRGPFNGNDGPSHASTSPGDPPHPARPHPFSRPALWPTCTPSTASATQCIECADSTYLGPGCSSCAAGTYQNSTSNCGGCGTCLCGGRAAAHVNHLGRCPPRVLAACSRLGPPPLAQPISAPCDSDCATWWVVALGWAKGLPVARVLACAP